MGDNLKQVGQNIHALGYVSQKGWSDLCDKFMGYTPRKSIIKVPTALLNNLKSEADRAYEMFAKKQTLEKSPDAHSKEKQKFNPFKFDRKQTENPFAVEKPSKNPFDTGGFEK